MANLEQKYLSSREVAEMVEKPHNDLMKDIRRYVEQLGEGNISHTNYFTESTYISEQNKELPCYLVTKKGCEFIANKLTGVKGAVFTARYIDKFHEMEEIIQKPKNNAEMLLMFAQQMVEQEQRLSSVEEQIKVIESKQSVPTEYFTISGYANLKGYKVDVTKANLLGRYATKISQKYGYEIGSVPDQKWGKVNAYHLDILKETFRGYANA